MAKFELVSKDGKVEVEIVGEPGDELMPDQVIAYSQMFAAHSLGQIADRLGDIADRISELARIEQKASD
ncbi:MAG: hypothetical protein V7686_00390 [Qipengyuania sp.]